MRSFSGVQDCNVIKDQHFVAVPTWWHSGNLPYITSVAVVAILRMDTHAPGLWACTSPGWQTCHQPRAGLLTSVVCRINHDQQKPEVCMLCTWHVAQLHAWLSCMPCGTSCRFVAGRTKL